MTDSPPSTSFIFCMGCCVSGSGSRAEGEEGWPRLGPPHASTNSHCNIVYFEKHCFCWCYFTFYQIKLQYIAYLTTPYS